MLNRNNKNSGEKKLWIYFMEIVIEISKKKTYWNKNQSNSMEVQNDSFVRNKTTNTRNTTQRLRLKFKCV